ncbi:MAG TPA: DUF896 domain-containing protein [Bacilli bacterium]
MNMDEVIERINQLARKKKSEGLTETEAEEQNQLRQRYIESIKGSLKSHLDSIKVVDHPVTEDKPEEE